MWRTHEVFNQVPALADVDLFGSDAALREAVGRHGAGWHAEVLAAQGEQLGNTATLRLADLANRHPPELVTYDRSGRRVDRVEFHPAWPELMRMLYADGVHSSAWLDPRPGAHVARAASFFLHGQAEAGSLCPVTMTFASLPVLRREPALFAQLEPGFRSREYDPQDAPLSRKTSVTIGMGMTEKQGGSDLRGNTTRANANGRSAGGLQTYTLVGHKWFFSVPTCDAHLVLARTGEALSCFYVSRWLPNGSRNAVRILRLKDKLGNRSNASAEVEFEDAIGILVGDEGRGIATIMEMAAQTRLDCVLGSAALMRRALVEAIQHARHRSAFGRLLAEQPLMQSVLADLALESEAATALAMRLAASVEQSDESPRERAYRRIVTPAAKFWICKRAIAFAAECMEVCGGNGYVEDGPMARIFREAPVNSIWEGSGNVMCLDVLRAAARERDALDALLQDLGETTAGETLLQRTFAALSSALQSPAEGEPLARRTATQLVLLAQATLLRRHAPGPIADAFIASRFDGSGQVAGLPEARNASAILARAWPD